VNWGGLQKALFTDEFLTDEVGSFRGLYMTRATDPAMREKAQHGGTVSALAALALESGLIDSFVMSGEGSRYVPEPVVVETSAEVKAAAGSKFGMSPVLSKFNEISKEGEGSIGVIATPCQSLALGKMKANPDEKDKDRLGRLKLVIGLFCGWTLDWDKLEALIKDKMGEKEILSIDIPPSKHACMEVTTKEGITEIPIDEVNKCVRDNCSYCYDMTAEFADISVGSARSSEGWEVDKGWNQVVVRSEAGQQLLGLAREKGILEFKEVPEANVDKLKAASLGKKRKCLKALQGKAEEGEGATGYLRENDKAVKVAL
jgi:coenzyme F420 hydrogenase subunit beta